MEPEDIIVMCKYIRILPYPQVVFLCICLCAIDDKNIMRGTERREVNDRERVPQSHPESLVISTFYNYHGYLRSEQKLIGSEMDSAMIVQEARG